MHQTGVKHALRSPCIISAYAVLHKMSPAQMKTAFRKLYENRLDCKNITDEDLQGPTGHYEPQDGASKAYKKYKFVSQEISRQISRLWCRSVYKLRRKARLCEI